MLLASALLAVAISTEVTSSALLPRTEGFTRPGWSVLVALGYAVSIWLLTLVVRTMPVSVAYAIWAGAGTALVAVAGVVFLGEGLGVVKGTGLVLIVLGVVVLNLSPGSGPAHG